MHQSSNAKMLAFRNKYLNDKRGEPLLILDLGSLDVNGSYREHFDISPWIYRGMDLTPGANVDIVLKNPYNWREIGANSVDILISGQAFEHIEFFWITMLEIARVLKPGGLSCTIAPSAGIEHRYPVDCWRFYPDGFSALARYVRLEALEVYTQWEPDPQFTDDSNRWQDTVLVCRKPLISWYRAWRRQLWRSVLHKVSILGV